MNTQIIPIVEQTVVARLQSRSSFTAPDISNALKLDRYAVTHRDVAVIVRDIFQSGAMDFYDFYRRLIAVTTDGGTKQVQAFLYLHSNAKEREYTTRQQSSLSCVASGQARALPDMPLLLMRPHPRRASKPVQTGARRSRKRRDGALAVPRALIAQLGWTTGVALGLSVQSGQIRLTPGEGVPVQVWAGLRVRICRRKLRLCGLMQAERLTVRLDGNKLRVEEE